MTNWHRYSTGTGGIYYSEPPHNEQGPPFKVGIESEVTSQNFLSTTNILCTTIEPSANREE